jgi:hypothetical protein
MAAIEPARTLVLQPWLVIFMPVGLPVMVAGAGAGLVSASPPRPAQPVAGIAGGPGDQGGEQVLDLQRVPGVGGVAR